MLRQGVTFDPSKQQQQQADDAAVIAAAVAEAVAKALGQSGNVPPAVRSVGPEVAQANAAPLTASSPETGTESGLGVPAAPGHPGVAPGHGHADDENPKARAFEVLSNGGSLAQAAAAADKSTRTIERWRDAWRRNGDL
jgi:hypothetical protein